MKKFFILLLAAGLLQSCYVLLGIGCGDILGGSYNDPLGAQVGIEAKVYELNENSSLNAGIGISQQGGKYSELEGSGTVYLTYLNVPILYNYQTNSGFYGEVGLQPGYVLRAKDKWEGTVEDFMYGINKFHLGLPVGIGYQINENISVGVRSTFGVTNVENTGGSYHNLITVGKVTYKIPWRQNH